MPEIEAVLLRGVLAVVAANHHCLPIHHCLWPLALRCRVPAARGKSRRIVRAREQCVNGSMAGSDTGSNCNSNGGSELRQLDCAEGSRAMGRGRGSEGDGVASTAVERAGSVELKVTQRHPS